MQALSGWEWGGNVPHSERTDSRALLVPGHVSKEQAVPHRAPTQSRRQDLWWHQAGRSAESREPWGAGPSCQ